MTDLDYICGMQARAAMLAACAQVCAESAADFTRDYPSESAHRLRLAIEYQEHSAATYRRAREAMERDHG